MFSFLKNLFGTANDRAIKKLKAEIQQINILEDKISVLSDDELANKTIEFRQQIANGTTLDALLYEAFAVVREASKRIYGMRHFDVQLMGGIVLHRGMIAEMRTGEGKTLVATLPAYLNALSGKGVHVVTVNDYLVKRDSEWMGKIYQFLGLTVGRITHDLDDEQRRQAYECDITHITNNELGFDYLRDNMKYTNDAKVLRDFNFAIIDEVDSILIDEARTPLIISGPVDDRTDLYDKINYLIRDLPDSAYEKDEKMRTVNLTESGTNQIELLLIQYGLIANSTSMYDFENLPLIHYISQALKAHSLFKRDVDYLVRDGKVMIIDEFTGRVMEGRRYSEGLHQAIEAKENVKIQNENQTLASITFQNYFRLYPKLAGMTGTAMTEAAELKDIYNLDVIAIPTHNSVTRIDHDDEIYGSKQDKLEAIVKLTKNCYDRGQPVLVGTVSIEKSEELSNMFNKNNIKHNVLNAKQHESEAQFIAQAGRPYAVTIATNMAGRGTDIMLGGNAEALINKLEETNLTPEQKSSETQKIKQLIAEQKLVALKAGGLFVIGTERHESRRIDDQLRGRSGRQGDPGETKFFLSLEDDLMRIFASERMSGILRTLGLKDGEAIHHPMITRSLLKAQQKVEGHNYELRKNLLKFDDVMNEQRKIIYEQRNDIINSDNIEHILENMANETIENLVNNAIKPGSYREDWDIEQLAFELHRDFAFKEDLNNLLNADITELEIITQLKEIINSYYEFKKHAYSFEIMNSAVKYILLTTLDQVWKDHLHNLDHLRQGISLRAYAQKDPLIEYKREAFNLFEQMLENLRELFVQRVYYLHIDKEHLNTEELNLQNKRLQAMHETRIDPAFSNYNAGVSMEVALQPLKAAVKPEERLPNDPTSWGKIGRNELCPCNSGKKYKHCHGSEDV